MSPWKEVTPDCAEPDQQLKLTRAFDLTSLRQRSPAFKWESFPDPNHKLFSASEAADNWQDNWQVPLGLYDNNPLCLRHGTPLRRCASGYSDVSHVLYIFKLLLLEESQPNVIDNRFCGVVVHESAEMRVLLFFLTLKRYFVPLR